MAFGKPTENVLDSSLSDASGSKEQSGDATLYRELDTVAPVFPESPVVGHSPLEDPGEEDRARTLGASASHLSPVWPSVPATPSPALHTAGTHSVLAGEQAPARLSPSRDPRRKS